MDRHACSVEDLSRKVDEAFKVDEYNGMSHKIQKAVANFSAEYTFDVREVQNEELGIYKMDEFRHVWLLTLTRK
jgi:hypothetical protein